MLSSSTVLNADGVAIADVACRHRAGPGSQAEIAGGFALVLVRRGCFVRRVDGVASLLDPTVAYFMNPGEEQRYDHPHAHGDDCTWLGVSEELVLSLWGGAPRLPSSPIPVSPRLDLAHRLLLAGARGRADGRGSADARGRADVHGLVERAILVIAGALETADRRRVASGRPRTSAARRALADGAREALAANCGYSLPELAGLLAVSPHHLSRVFSSVNGHTIARHRMRLRVRAALERLAEGERDLARLAADLGFADQSHLCRVVRDETGTPPAALRLAVTGA
jgi:AraC-like DNA-binding protein